MMDTLVALEASTLAPVSEAEASLAPAAVTPSAFARLGLAPELLAAVADLGFTEPTAVQQATVGRALSTAKGAASDLMVSSQTGSGKTAAFLLPVIHQLMLIQEKRLAEEAARWALAQADAQARGEPAPKRPKRKNPTDPRHFKAATPGALVLCPTRELAQQVSADAIDLVRHCRGLRVAHVVGGMPYQVQIARLQNADLVVATPGRLLDLHRSMQIKLDQVQMLVVDEADRMLDLGFADDLAELHQLTAARGQTLMFSATFAPRIMQLASRLMREPQRIEIDSPQERHQSIEQTLHWADNLQHKRKLLDHWLRDAQVDQAVVFASTQIECDALAQELVQDGFHAVALHGALSQGLRNRRLSAFREGRVQFLVATDVAARGLDVPTITHVINFGLPMKAEDYVHRIGRTGRAGRRGHAITLAEFRDRRRIGDIEHYTRQSFKASVIAGLEPRQNFKPAAGRPERGGRPPGARSSGQGAGWGVDRSRQNQSFRQDRSAPAQPASGFARTDDRASRTGEAGTWAKRPPRALGPRSDARADPRSASRYEPRGNKGRPDVAPRPDFAPVRPGGMRGGAGRKPARSR